MVDVLSEAEVFDVAGKPLGKIELPGKGTVEGFGGEQDDKETFYVYTSYNLPASVYRYDVEANKSELIRQPKVKFDPAKFAVEQVFYNSKDGTRVPMILTYRKDLKSSEPHPTLLYGYGGYSISMTPTFKPDYIAWVEMGGVLAVANMRGGGEYGEAWHQQGMKLKKQNVFDDFIAAGEWLIANKYTSSERLAIQGGSNGGLLVGAVINQRPDLAKVAIPQVGVMDMLRFDKFTIGFNWIADYGSSSNPEEFKALYAYSPLHNIKAGAKYPATLITTADHDDRVVPAHSFKYAATLQEKAAKDTPILIRIDTKSGHGASSQTKALETTADIYAFIMHNMGLKPISGTQ
jgi:prolyl oligopeptidase